MEKQRRRDARGIVGKIAAVVFAAGFVLSIVPAIRALAEGTIFKIQSAEITEISTGATGSINTYDEQTIVSNVTFHKINDSISYKIVLQNSDSKDHIIESITDDNASESINYIYDAHAGETVAAGANLDFLLTAKYATAVTDTNKRAEVSSVKFFVKFTDVEEPEEIDIVVPNTNEEETPVVPNTGKNTAESNGASISLATMIISVIGLTILAIIAVKKHKKYAKIIGVAVVAVSAFGLVTSARAANIETNSFTLTTSYGLYDKLVIKNGDADVVINYGEKLEDVDEITEPTKPGYAFDGWEDENGNPVDPTKPITEDITIKPKFTANTYTVKFDANGGDGTMADMQFTYDEAQALTQNAFNFMGREYTGWDTKPNGSGVHYADKAEVKNLTTENNGIVTLYAQWSINPFHIDYDGNGATSGEMATTNCEYDEACELRENAFEKYGYDFVGWKYNDTIYADKADVTNIIDHGTITMQAQWTPHIYAITYTGLTTEEAAALRTAGNPDNYTVETASFTLIKPADRKDADGDVRERCIGWRDVTVYEDVTLPISNALGDKTYEAVWQTVALEEFDITYDYDGGNVATANPTKLNKEQSATLNEPEKTGYTFTGWTGTTISGDTPVKPYTIPAPHQKGKLEYTAHYRANTYTVNFDINTDDMSVSGTMQPLAFNYDEEKALTANAFTRTGYTFAGWELGDNEYTDGQTVKNLTAEDGATVTLKAQWTPTEYTVIFHANNENVENPDAMAAQVVIYDVETTLNPIEYTWWQHKLVEWTTNANGTGTKYADKATIKNLDANGGEIHLYAKWREIDAALQSGGIGLSPTGSKINALLADNPQVTRFVKYPNGTPSDEVLANAVDTSGTIDPIWLWVDGENIYWWSEDVKPRISDKNSTDCLFNRAGTVDGASMGLYADLTGFDTSGIVNFSRTFHSTGLKEIDISDWDFSNATNMSEFIYASSLKKATFPAVVDVRKVTNMNSALSFGMETDVLDLSGWKTRDVTSLSGLLYTMKAKKVIFSEDFKTDKVTSMANMFLVNTALTSIEGLEYFDTKNVTNMSGMFGGVSNLETLDLSTFDTTSLTNMKEMFSGMTKLSSLTLGGSFTAANVTNMQGAFNNIRGLETLDLSNLTSKPTGLHQTFAQMGSTLETIDISNMDLSGVTDLYWAFIGDSGLKTIYTSGSINPDSVTDDNAMFLYDSVVGGAGSTGANGNAGTGSNGGKNYAVIDDPDNGTPGKFTYKNARYIRYHDNDGDDTNDETNYALMPSHYIATGSENPYNLATKLAKNNFERSGFKFIGWAATADGIVIAADEAETSGLEASKTPLELYAQWKESSSMLHSGLRGISDDINSLAGDDILDSFEKYNNGTPDIDSLNTVIVSTNDSSFPTYIWREGDKVYWWSEADKVYMNPESGNMFYAVRVKNVSLVGLDSSKVTNLSRMFQGGIVESVNFGSNFDTSHVTTMGQMFWRTTGITSLDLSSFSSESLLTVGEMFTGNTNLQSVTFGNSFTLSDVASMASMFNGCSSLESIDLSKVTFENVTTINSLFDGASALTSITLGQNINAEKLTDASSAFKGTSSLTALDLSSFHAPNLADMSDMFRTTGVKNLDLSNLGATSITNIHEAFWGMTNLETIDISNLKLSGSQSPAGLFFNDSKLTTIYANDNTDFSSATSSTYGSATRLRGGAGTQPATNPSYLRIDDPDDGKPGVFTLRGSHYIRYHDNDGDTTNDEANRALMKSHYLKAGDSLKKNAFVRDGYVFTGWKDADNNEYIDEQVMADLTESKTPLELYAQWDAAPYNVTFDANGGEVLQSAKTVTYLQPYGELPTPVRYDYVVDPNGSILGSKYSFKEWNTKADGNGDTITSSSIYANADDTTLYAIWNDRFTVTIYNGESETPTITNYGIDDIVYLNAQNVAGKQFLYWEVDGAKKSYTKDYSMRMFQGKDLTIRAIYGSESDLESQQPGAYISDIYRRYSDNKVVVRSYSYVPDGYEIVKAGVIATLDANIANGTFDDQTATYPRAASVNGNSDNYYYTWTKGSVTSEQTVYAKAYLIYKDTDGVEHTIYGDLVTATLTE
ncbi:MAG: BspA family leucine-rich repeat surface protein [Candidatus Saccharibacteria bacterium]|nr:BspA family leucine-rich repeat surface protein [Candidatus Saccharibacteria bacterium]